MVYNIYVLWDNTGNIALSNLPYVIKMYPLQFSKVFEYVVVRERLDPLIRFELNAISTNTVPEFIARFSFTSFLLL